MSGYVSLALIAVILILIIIDIFYSKKIDKNELNKTTTPDNDLIDKVDKYNIDKKEGKNNGTHSE